MGSLDVDLLFTNIPPGETIDIRTNVIYNPEVLIEGKTLKSLFITTKESYFSFNEILYEQKDEAAIGSPSGSTLAKEFLYSCEKNGLITAL